MSSNQPQDEAEKNIEIWKVKKLIKRLESARGNGTSMISLIIRESDSNKINTGGKIFFVFDVEFDMLTSFLVYSPQVTDWPGR